MRIIATILGLYYAVRTNVVPGSNDVPLAGIVYPFFVPNPSMTIKAEEFASAIRLYRPK
jgi:hypothetical protein